MQCNGGREAVHVRKKAKPLGLLVPPAGDCGGDGDKNLALSQGRVSLTEPKNTQKILLRMCSEKLFWPCEIGR